MTTRRRVGQPQDDEVQPRARASRSDADDHIGVIDLACSGGQKIGLTTSGDDALTQHPTSKPMASAARDDQQAHLHISIGARYKVGVDDEAGAARSESAGPRRYPPRDVKTLWGFAAGRCSFPGCRRLCIEPTTEAGDQRAIVGDIAHVYPHARLGPRGTTDIPNGLDLDSYDNWVLLCATHHRQVDAQPTQFNAQFLLAAKQSHERWVEDRLGVARIDRAAEDPPLATRVRGVKVYRVFRKHYEPWRVPVGPGLGRWDDPYGEFPVIYAARSAKAAVAETLARFQTSIPRDLSEELTNYGATVSMEGASVPSLAPNVLPADWVSGRSVAEGVLTDVHLADLRSISGADIHGWAGELQTLEVREMRSLARLLHALRDAGGRDRYDGIVYTSRVTGDELFALFGDRVNVALIGIRPLRDCL